jgi:hypothetical protein
VLFPQDAMRDWARQMQQSTSFDLDSIRLVFEMMEGGGNVTINRVEDGHGREEGGEDTTITLSRGCSNPSSVDHATIDIKSKGSGRRICRMKTQRKTTINCEEGNWIFRYVCSLHILCFLIKKSDNEYCIIANDIY